MIESWAMWIGFSFIFVGYLFQWMWIADLKRKINFVEYFGNLNREDITSIQKKLYSENERVDNFLNTVDRTIPKGTKMGKKDKK